MVYFVCSKCFCRMSVFLIFEYLKFHNLNLGSIYLHPHKTVDIQNVSVSITWGSAICGHKCAGWTGLNCMPRDIFGKKRRRNLACFSTLHPKMRKKCQNIGILKKLKYSLLQSQNGKILRKYAIFREKSTKIGN